MLAQAQTRSAALFVIFLISVEIVLQLATQCENLILASALGGDAYGHYEYIMSIGRSVAVCIVCGFDLVLVRLVSLHLAQKDGGLLKGAILSSLFIPAWCTTVALICLILGGSDSEWILTATFASLFALLTMTKPFLQAFGLAGASTIPKSVVYPVTSLVVILFCVKYLSADLNVVLQAKITVLIVINVLFGALIAWRLRDVMRGDQRIKLDLSLWWTIALPMAVFTACWMLQRQLDIIFLNHYVSKSTLASYALNSPLGLLTALGQTATNTYFGPLFAAAVASGDPTALQALARKGATISLLTSILCAVVILISAPALIELAGHHYEVDFAVILAVQAGQLANVSSGSVAILLIMSGRQMLVARYYALFTVFGMIGYLILIPLFGAVGAALSLALSIAALNVLLSRKVRELLLIRPGIDAIVRPSVVLASSADGRRT